MKKAVSTHVQDALRASKSVVPVRQRAVMAINAKMVRPDPHQPRSYMEPQLIEALADNIGSFGQLTPAVVRRSVNDDTGETEYWLISGERRLRAIQTLEKRDGRERTIDCIIMESNGRALTPVEILEAQIIENVCREEMSVIEESLALRRIMEMRGFSRSSEVAAHFALDRSEVSRIVRVSEIASSLLEDVVRESRGLGKDPRGFLLELVDVPESDRVDLVAQAIASSDLTRRFVRTWRAARSEQGTSLGRDPMTVMVTVAGEGGVSTPGAPSSAVGVPGSATTPAGHDQASVSPSQAARVNVRDSETPGADAFGVASTPGAPAVGVGASPGATGPIDVDHVAGAKAAVTKNGEVEAKAFVADLCALMARHDVRGLTLSMEQADLVNQVLQDVVWQVARARSEPAA